MGSTIIEKSIQKTEQRPKFCYWELIMSVMLSTAILLVVGYFWQFRWEGGDDFNISQILSGAYGEQSPYVLVMQYPLSWLLCKLYSVAPGVNFLGLAELFSVLCAFSVFYFLLMKKHKKWGILTALFFGLLFQPAFYMSLQYTRSSIILSLAGGTMLVYTLDHKKSIIWSLFAILLVWVGMMFRWSGGYIVLPFIALMVLFCHCGLLFKIKQNLRAVILCGVLLLGLYGVKVIDDSAYERFNAESDWSAFNSSRAAVVDYLPSVYPEGENLVVSANDYKMIQYSMIFDEYFSQDLFEEIIESIDRKNDTTAERVAQFLNKIPDGIVKYVRNGKMVGQYNLFVMLILAFLAVCLFIQKRNVLMVLFTVGGTLFISAYFVWCGRFPPWVQDSLYLTAGFVLLYSIDFECDAIKKRLSDRKICGILSAVFIVIFSLSTLITVKQCEMRVRSNYNEELLHCMVEVMESNKSDIYLIDSFSGAPFPVMDGYPIWESQEKDSWNNIFRSGTWFWGHPVIEKQMDKLGIESLIKEIPEKGIMILTKEESPTLKMYQTFYLEHYGKEVEPERCWSDDGYAIYKLNYVEEINDFDMEEFE